VNHRFINFKGLIYLFIVVGMLSFSCVEKNPQQPENEPEPSPYRLIVNARDSLGRYNIYTITDDGKNLNKIFSDSDWIGDLSVSHSGSYVVCCAKITDRYALYQINLDGSGSKQITPYESALYFEPQWFPDDDEILTGRFGYHAQFYRILINGSVITRITTDDSISYRFPRLSPDGLKIAYEKRSIPKNTIWVMDADGKNEKLLSEPFYEDWRPEWTGDAAYIVYFNSKGLWLINADGSDRKFLIETGYNHAHHCSPANSNKIVFGNINGVFLIKNDGTGLKQLSDVSCSGYPILWSHDGSRIAFRGDANNDGEKGVCIIKLNESEIYEITFSHLNIADAPSRAFDWIANQIE